VGEIFSSQNRPDADETGPQMNLDHRMAGHEPTGAVTCFGTSSMKLPALATFASDIPGGLGFAETPPRWN